MNRYTVAYTSASLPDQIEAEYTQVEDGWVYFKTADHKTVFMVAAGEVLSVRKVEPNVVITLSGPVLPATTTNAA